jgi:hypothetical protein
MESGELGGLAATDGAALAPADSDALALGLADAAAPGSIDGLGLGDWAVALVASNT